MSLTTCRKCKKKVLETEEKCPHCGVVGPALKLKQGCLGIIIISLIISGLVTLCSSEQEEIQPSVEVSIEPPKQQANDKASSISKPELSEAQKHHTLNKFEEIISFIKLERDKIQHVRSTQPLGRGQSGSIYIAKWNGNIQHWEKQTKDENEDIFGKYLNAPYCRGAAYNVASAMGRLKQLGIGYVFGDASPQEKHLLEDIGLSEKEISLCRNKIKSPA